MNIRRFEKGVDEAAWVLVLNRANEGLEDWRAITLEEFVEAEKNPEFDFRGRFIAEIEGRPVGRLHAHVDPQREEPKGFLRFGVVPESRGRGLERLLIETGLTELAARGINVAEAEAGSERPDQVRLLEEMGFRQVRVFSSMEMDLTGMRRNIGENREVTIRPLRITSEDDIKLFNWLDNESFKEHFNFRPDTLEMTRYALLSDPFVKEQEHFFAEMEGRAVGYVGVSIDEKYNAEKGVEAGDICTIGVLRAYRRAGIGTRLMLHALERLRAKGMSTALLGVDDDNPTRAIRLYERVGFRVKTKRFAFEREVGAPAGA